MARSIANEEIRSTSTQYFTITNTDSPLTFQYINGLDVDVDITVEATHDNDDSFSEAVELMTNKTITNGSEDYDTMGFPWDKLRFAVTPISSPSSGSLKILKMVH